MLFIGTEVPGTSSCWF